MTHDSRMAIITFASTHHAMAAEDTLREAGIALEVVPPPREVSVGCGLALRIALTQVPAAREILGNKGGHWLAIHEIGSAQEVIRTL